ncbi:conserved hypothetical protein [Bradyrhizobium sp. STM 3843]|uniref:hypothetical protein n=1 Tax=Bradyrhizobium sp. STM 3843 TaxID=551947 RepID=UPI0002405579|nr:hypothetical protein [Bradyrhizobium sp. STM 3843]CCE09415.1 conserved hypothetical protein [Bradyrhizobium sp. STM 3843]
MSEHDSTPPPLPPRQPYPPEQQGEGCLTGLMVLAGLVLMFPSACVILVFGQQLKSSDWTSPIGLIFLGAAAAGLALFVLALRRWR